MYPIYGRSVAPKLLPQLEHLLSSALYSITPIYPCKLYAGRCDFWYHCQ